MDPLTRRVSQGARIHEARWWGEPWGVWRLEGRSSRRPRAVVSSGAQRPPSRSRRGAPPEPPGALPSAPRKGDLVIGWFVPETGAVPEAHRDRRIHGGFEENTTPVESLGALIATYCGVTFGLIVPSGLSQRCIALGRPARRQQRGKSGLRRERAVAPASTRCAAAAAARRTRAPAVAPNVRRPRTPGAPDQWARAPFECPMLHESCPIRPYPDRRPSAAIPHRSAESAGSRPGPDPASHPGGRRFESG